jgi:hypothetical protein
VSTRDILIDKLESALRRLKVDGESIAHEHLLNHAISEVESAIRRWRAETSRPQLFAMRGRPTVVENDARVLRALREAEPGSDCWKEFAGKFGRNLSKHRIRARYRAADKKIAKVDTEQDDH